MKPVTGVPGNDRPGRDEPTRQPLHALMVFGWWSLVALLFLGCMVVPFANPPLGLTATAVSSTEVLLEWTDVATGESGYGVDRRPDSEETWVAVATTGPDAESYLDEGLTPATDYVYRVYSVKSTGSSDSVEVRVTTLP